jgi:hypothetical protein
MISYFLLRGRADIRQAQSAAKDKRRQPKVTPR